MKKVRKSKIKAKAKKQPTYKYVCFRCTKSFPTRRGLKMHSKAHLRALREIKMLEEGHTPLETKFGVEFRGKNKVVVAES
jgi:hypothetical protein